MNRAPRSGHPDLARVDLGVSAVSEDADAQSEAPGHRLTVVAGSPPAGHRPSSDLGPNAGDSPAPVAAASGDRSDRHRAGHHESSARTAVTGHAVGSGSLIPPL
jgi:hypothetical protein